MISARKSDFAKGLRLLFAVICLLALTVSCALAAGDPIELKIDVNPAVLSAPGPVNVALSISNTGTEAVSAGIYDPNGEMLETRTVEAGKTSRYDGTFDVTQELLDAGSITYTAKYSVTDETGELVECTAKAQAKLAYDGAHAGLQITRTVTPEVARGGSTVTVIYVLYNSGNVDLTNIQIKETISKTAKTVNKLAAGESSTVNFTSKIGSADLKSAATVTYKAAGSTETLKETVEETVIELAKPGLKFEVSAENTDVNVNEAAKLHFTFINTGNVSYTNVSVKDAVKGEILSNLSIPAGQTVTADKEFILNAKTEFKITAVASDNTGSTKTITPDDPENGVIVFSVYDPEKVIRLTLNLTADSDAVQTFPADVRMTLQVTNNSNIKADKIKITHGTVEIAEIDTLAPGAGTTLVRDVRLSSAGKFRFTATCKDTLGNTVTFDSNTLKISKVTVTAAPTVVPRVTVAPPVLVTAAPADSMLTQLRDVFMTLSGIAAAVAAVLLLFFLIVTVVRAVKKAKSNAAYDHMNIEQSRDYMVEGDEDEESAAEEPAGPVDDIKPVFTPSYELPSERLMRESAAAEKDAAQQGESDPGTSASETFGDDAPAAVPLSDIPVSDAPVTEEPRRRRRHSDDDE